MTPDELAAETRGARREEERILEPPAEHRPREIARGDAHGSGWRRRLGASCSAGRAGRGRWPGAGSITSFSTGRGALPAAGGARDNCVAAKALSESSSTRYPGASSPRTTARYGAVGVKAVEPGEGGVGVHRVELPEGQQRLGRVGRGGPVVGQPAEERRRERRREQRIPRGLGAEEEPEVPEGHAGPTESGSRRRRATVYLSAAASAAAPLCRMARAASESPIGGRSSSVLAAQRQAQDAEPRALAAFQAPGTRAASFKRAVARAVSTSESRSPSSYSRRARASGVSRGSFCSRSTSADAARGSCRPSVATTLSHANVESLVASSESAYGQRLVGPAGSGERQEEVVPGTRVGVSRMTASASS